MTLLVRDEADIVDAQLAFHLHAGVDFVLAMDHRSQDGTTEILERYERAGLLHLIREESADLRQAEWVTRMARLAATDFGADWVINTDADEFWWPRGGSLKDVLETIPERYGVVRGCWRHFLPRPDTDPFFAERMTVRLRTPAFPGDKRTVFHAHQKVAHRADPEVTIEFGNHNALGRGLEPVRAWHPIEVLHFSFRSYAQLVRKCHYGRRNLPTHVQTANRLAMWEAEQTGRLPEYYDDFVVGDDELERGLADGTLAVDTRLRDALRELRGADGDFRAPEPGVGGLAFSRPDVSDDAVFADEASVLVEIDGVVRAEQRVEKLEQRLRELERGPLARLRRAGNRLAPR
jgi:Glycosyl transferase family 2